MKTILTECLKCWPCFKILGISLFSSEIHIQWTCFSKIVYKMSYLLDTWIKTYLHSTQMSSSAGFSVLLSESHVFAVCSAVTHDFLSNLVMIKAFPSEQAQRTLCLIWSTPESSINGNANGLWLGYYVSAVFQD